MELSVKERGLLLNVLPKEGNLFTIKIVHELKLALSFSEEEHKALNFRPTPDGLGTMWDEIPGKEIEIGPKAQEIIRKGLEEMDKAQKLVEDYLPICAKFGYEGTEA